MKRNSQVATTHSGNNAGINIFCKVTLGRTNFHVRSCAQAWLGFGQHGSLNEAVVQVTYQQNAQRDEDHWTKSVG